MRPTKVPVPSVDRANLSGAQMIALAHSNSSGRRLTPEPVPVIRGPVVEPPPGITPTDRARKAVQAALRHVSYAEVVALVAEFAPEPVAIVAAAPIEPAPASVVSPEPEPVAIVAAAL